MDDEREVFSKSFGSGFLLGCANCDAWRIFWGYSSFHIRLVAYPKHQASFESFSGSQRNSQLMVFSTSQSHGP